MLTNENILKDVENALKELDTVDIQNSNESTRRYGQKKVIKAYDILFDLRKKLQNQL